MRRKTMRSQTALRIAAAACLSSLAGCGTVVNDEGVFFGLVSPYRIDVQQGNVVTQEQLARLKPGMNRLQVRDALGSPLLTDAFHTDRWDYVFTLRQSGRPLQRRNVVLTFDGEVLKSIEAPELPTEREFIDSIARPGRIVAAAELELTPDQLRALPLQPRMPPTIPINGTPNPIPATRTFPPLEPS
jgi:outer membrane protein assembly factor BamE